MVKHIILWQLKEMDEEEKQTVKKGIKAGLESLQGKIPGLLSIHVQTEGLPSFDKQFARDWLKANDGHDWTLPKDIVDKTIDKYLQAYELLTGEKL